MSEHVTRQLLAAAAAGLLTLGAAACGNDGGDTADEAGDTTGAAATLEGEGTSGPASGANGAGAGTVGPGAGSDIANFRGGYATDRLQTNGAGAGSPGVGAGGNADADDGTVEVAPAGS